MTKPEIDNLLERCLRDLFEENGGRPVSFILLNDCFLQQTNHSIGEVIANLEGAEVSPRDYLNRMPGVRVLTIGGRMCVEPTTSLVSEPPRRAKVESQSREVSGTAQANLAQNWANVETDLENFSFIEYGSLLPTLVRYAQPEPWGTGAWILKYRLRGLFTWLAYRRNEAEASARESFLVVRGNVAAMPLGLRDRSGKAMALLFTPNRRRTPKWYTSGEYVVAPGMPMAQQANAIYASLFQGGEPTLQWPVMREQTFDVSAPINEQTLLRKLTRHLSALDEAFLEDLCRDFPNIRPYFEQTMKVREAARRSGCAPGFTPPDELEAWRAFSNALAENFEVQEALLEMVKVGVRNAQNRAREESTAASVYNARTNATEILLPFLPKSETDPVCAFSLTSADAEGYNIGTVLNLDQAYAAARVVKRQPRWWLRPPEE